MFKKKNKNVEIEGEELQQVEEAEEKPLSKAEKEKRYKIKTFVFGCIFFALATWLFVDCMTKIADVLANNTELQSISAIINVIMALLPSIGASLLSLFFMSSCIKSKIKVLSIISLVLTFVSLAYIICVLVLVFGVNKGTT